MKETDSIRTKLSLSLADAGQLQDAWHYATLICHRKDSTFDGVREFVEGIRGQVRAYEMLIAIVDRMSADNETWQIVKGQYAHPQNWDQVATFATCLLRDIEERGIELGVDARTGEPISHSPGR